MTEATNNTYRLSGEQENFALHKQTNRYKQRLQMQTVYQVLGVCENIFTTSFKTSDMVGSIFANL